MQKGTFCVFASCHYSDPNLSDKIIIQYIGSYAIKFHHFQLLSLCRTSIVYNRDEWTLDRCEMYKRHTASVTWVLLPDQDYHQQRFCADDFEGEKTWSAIFEKLNSQSILEPDTVFFNIDLCHVHTNKRELKMNKADCLKVA